MIFKYFRRKIQQKNWAFLTQNKAKLCKILIITLVFDKNANFFAENCQKSQKIAIITSTLVDQPLPSATCWSCSSNPFTNHLDGLQLVWIGQSGGHQLFPESGDRISGLPNLLNLVTSSVDQVSRSEAHS
jgi:hypothetical protein